MLILQTILYFLIFTFLSFFVFYLLGFSLVSRRFKSLKKQEVIGLSLCLGVVLFVLLAIVFGRLNLRNLVLPLLLLTDLFLLIKFKQKLFLPWKLFWEDKLFLFLIIAGIFVQGMINFPSGFLYSEGLYFWSSQGHDGLWHVAVMEEIKKSFPPENPAFAGEPLYNYHYLVDVLMGEFGRIFPFFSSLDLYFRFFPVLFSLMIGITIFTFMTKWQDNRKIGYLAMCFIYFVGSFGYIVNFLRTGSVFGGETVFWAAQQNTILGNPPHAISHSLLPAFFLCFLFFVKTRDKFWFFTSFLVASVLAGFKVSGGLVMLSGLGFATLVDLIFNRRFSILLLASFLGISNFLTFKLMTRGGSSFLMFLPWWFVRTTIVDRLGWMDLELRRQHYLAQGTWHAWLRVIQLEITAFLIFVIGNLGIRVLGLLELIRRLIITSGINIKEPFEVMIFMTMLTGLIIPLLFVQKGLIYNNIQFMQYFLLIFGFYAAITIYKILIVIKNKLARTVVMILIFSLGVPTVAGNLVELYGPRNGPLSKIVTSHLAALKYLKDNSLEDAVVLTKPFDPNLKNYFPSQPRPIYAWYDTPYVSALTGRRTYLSSEHVTLLDYPQTPERQEKMHKFFAQQDLSWNKVFLKEAGIDYIYLAKQEIEKPLDLEKNNLEVFLENEEVIVYRFRG